jgi:hypothetical protein
MRTSRKTGIEFFVSGVSFALLLLAPQAYAQNPSPGGVNTGQAVLVRPIEAPDARRLVDEAKALAKSGSIDGAEAKLTELNLAIADSPAWQMETSQRLLQLASTLSRENSAAQASAVVGRALLRLTQANEKAVETANVGGRAQVAMLSGHLHERFRGDSASAIASYKAALALEPKNRAAKEALERLQRSEAVLRARIGQSRN